MDPTYHGPRATTIRGSRDPRLRGSPPPPATPRPARRPIREPEPARPRPGYREVVRGGDYDESMVDGDGPERGAADDSGDLEMEQDVSDEHTGSDDDDDEDEDDEDEDDEAEAEDEDMKDGAGSGDESAQDVAMVFDPAAEGLKEISNLGKFTVSSYKPGNGVDELRSDELALFWQSDGPQPHKLTVYFIKRVGIRDIRFYVDAAEDESYTPIKVVFKAGTGENNLIEFATMELVHPMGWQIVPVAGAGGGSDGNTLYSYVLQMQVLENHQNGKDTHLRGIKIFALDGDAGAGTGRDGAHEGGDERGAEGGAKKLDQVKESESEPDGGGHGRNGSSHHRGFGRSHDDGGGGGGGSSAGEPVGQSELDGLMARLEREVAEINWEDGLGLPDFMKEPDLR